MAIADHRKPHNSDGKLWKLCPFWQSGTTSSSSSSTQNLHSQNHSHQNGVGSNNSRSTSSVTSVARSLLPARRRLRLDPANNLYFPCASPLTIFDFIYITFSFPFSSTIFGFFMSCNFVLECEAITFCFY